MTERRDYIPAGLSQYGGKVSACAVTADGNAFRVYIQGGSVVINPVQGFECILQAGRKRIFRCQSVIDGNHYALGTIGQAFANRIAQCGCTNNKTAAMKIDQHR
ncbi:hypothetical protein D3C81_1831790 [compost metagenome]